MYARVSAAAGDTASNLGSAVDELMRHQPTLKTDATTAIIKVHFQFRKKNPLLMRKMCLRIATHGSFVI